MTGEIIKLIREVCAEVEADGAGRIVRLENGGAALFYDPATAHCMVKDSCEVRIIIIDKCEVYEQRALVAAAEKEK